MLEASWSSFENTQEVHVRMDKGIVESGDSLCGYPVEVARGCFISQGEFFWHSVVACLIFSKQSWKMKASFLTSVPEKRAAFSGRGASHIATPNGENALCHGREGPWLYQETGLCASLRLHPQWFEKTCVVFSTVLRWNSPYGR